MSGNFTEVNKPLELFSRWLAEAEASEPNDPNAMAVATVDESGMPNVRMVLLKDYSEKGFVFYTNFESAKGRELLASQKTALLFHWKSCGGRCAFEVRWKWSARKKRMPITTPGRAAAASGPGHPSNPDRWKAVLRLKRPLLNIPPNSISDAFRARIIGPVFGLYPKKLNSGTTAVSDCMIASFSSQKARVGKRHGFTLKLMPPTKTWITQLAGRPSSGFFLPFVFFFLKECP